MKYKPHNYQKYAIEFIKEHPVAAILLDMGMGKTSIVCSALNDLMYDSLYLSCNPCTFCHLICKICVFKLQSLHPHT